jgi:hypothetical protein
MKNNKYIKIWDYLSFSDNKVRIGKIKNNRRPIPVIIIDLITKNSLDYGSINQAAYFLNAHPKTI